MVHLGLGVPLLALYICITLKYAVRKKAIWSYITKIVGNFVKLSYLGCPKSFVLFIL